MSDMARGLTVTALRGLVALLFGLGVVLFLVTPTINLVVLFGAYALIDGALALAAARAGADRPALKAFLIGEGLVGIGVGLLTFLLSAYWSIALPHLIATWMIATGALRLGENARRPQDRRGRWLLLVAGLGSFPVGVLLFVLPAAPALALIGVSTFALGVILLVVAGGIHALQARRPV